MTSIICPNCKSHISEWDLNCLNCGMTITEELREKLVRKMQEQRASESSKEASLQEKALKLRRKFTFQRKLNRISLRLFKTGFAEVVVPFFVAVLLLIIVVLIIKRDTGFLF